MKHEAQTVGFLVGIVMTVLGMFFNWAPVIVPGGAVGAYYIVEHIYGDFARVAPAWLAPIYISMQMVTWAWLCSIIGIAIMTIMFVSIAAGKR
ncbi:MAG: hypothetical protein QXS27_07300 [Candidatus Jordarchaeaceae archaeon]